MKTGNFYIILGLTLALISSCTYSRKFTNEYFQENETRLESIRKRYKALYEKNPFSLELKDPQLNRIGLEIHTDSVRYVYTFRTDEPYLIDTLYKYNYDVKAISELINDMQQAHCTWITNLDYYERRQRKYMVFLSVRHKKLNSFLRPEKYFTLAFFDESQVSDEKGRLMDNEFPDKVRKINSSTFRKLKDMVFYALSKQFR